MSQGEGLVSKQNKKNRYLGGSSMDRRIYRLIPDQGWNIQDNKSAVLSQLAKLVKEGAYKDQEELAQVFGHHYSWVSKKIKQYKVLGLLAEHDWTNCVMSKTNV